MDLMKCVSHLRPQKFSSPLLWKVFCASCSLCLSTSHLLHVLIRVPSQGSTLLLYFFLEVAGKPMSEPAVLSSYCVAFLLPCSLPAGLSLPPHPYARTDSSSFFLVCFQISLSFSYKSLYKKTKQIILLACSPLPLWASFLMSIKGSNQMCLWWMIALAWVILTKRSIWAKT